MEEIEETSIVKGKLGEVILPIEGTLEIIHFYEMLVELGDDTPIALIHPRDFRDLYTWPIDSTGLEFKEEMMEGGVVKKFGEITLYKTMFQMPGIVTVISNGRVGYMIKNYEVEDDTSK